MPTADATVALITGSERGFALEMIKLNHILIVSDVNENSAESLAKAIRTAALTQRF